MLSFLRLGAIGLAVAGLAFEASASGSAGPGSAYSSPRGAYSTGKGLVFRTLVCRTCPIQPRELDRERAQSLKARLVVALDKVTGTAPDDDPVSALCAAPGPGSAECAERLGFVLAYLDRRYRL